MPGLAVLLDVAYLTLHLAVTAAVLLWLHQRRPTAFPFVRTTLLVASALGLVGFLAYPTAPPRLAGIGIADTVSNGHVNLNDGLVSSLYNPYAAVPSMHIGYALIVATSLLRYGRGRLVRALGTLYPAFVLLVVVATGNHFFLDAAGGALVAALAIAAASLLTRAAVKTHPSRCQSATYCLPPKSWPRSHHGHERLEREHDLRGAVPPSTCPEGLCFCAETTVPAVRRVPRVVGPRTLS
jgi:hypothetical protein